MKVLTDVVAAVLTGWINNPPSEDESGGVGACFVWATEYRLNEVSARVWVIALTSVESIAEFFGIVIVAGRMQDLTKKMQGSWLGLRAHTRERGEALRQFFPVCPLRLRPADRRPRRSRNVEPVGPPDHQGECLGQRRG